MHFDMAMDKEVAAQMIFLCTFVRMVAVLESFGQQQNRRCFRFDYKRLGGSNAAHVNRLIGETPTLCMEVEVVPVHCKIKIEDVPANFLPGVRHDRRSVAYEGAFIEAIGRQVIPAGLDNAVLTWTTVGPNHLS